MTSTPAWVWHGTHDLRLEERQLPALQPTDVLVEVVACGVCATDLHMLDGSIALYQPPRVLAPLPHAVHGNARSGAPARSRHT